MSPDHLHRSSHIFMRHFPASLADRFIVTAVLLALFFPSANAAPGQGTTQQASGIITLTARDATTHGTQMRYEPATNKNCLGFWTNPEDWADWTFNVAKPGTFIIEVWQGC